MTDIVDRLREGVFGSDETKTDAVIHSHMQAAANEIERLREALKDMLHAVCGETGFAAAVRAHSETAYPWEPLDIAEEKARAALREDMP